VSSFSQAFQTRVNRKANLSAPANILQGALGKTAGRSYKAAPRQLLQVDPSNSSSHAHISKEDAIRQHGEGAAKEAAKIGAEALGLTADVRALLLGARQCAHQFLAGRHGSQGPFDNKGGASDSRASVRSGIGYRATTT
jgi:hypothetical protein